MFSWRPHWSHFAIGDPYRWTSQRGLGRTARGRLDPSIVRSAEGGDSGPWGSVLPARANGVRVLDASGATVAAGTRAPAAVAQRPGPPSSGDVGVTDTSPSPHTATSWPPYVNETVVSEHGPPEPSRRITWSSASGSKVS